MGVAFTAAQAVGAGSSYRWLSRGVACRVYERPWRGVYVSPGASWKDLLVAAGMAAGGEAVISHRAAAQLHGLWGFESNLIELTIPPDRRFARRGMIVHQSPLDGADVTTAGGVSGVTTLARTVIDLAAVVYGVDFEIAFESAWYRDRHLLDDLESRLEELGPGRHGIQRLRRLIASARRRQRPLESPLEVRFWGFLKGARLPLPSTGVEIDDGSGRPYRLDFVYPGQKLAIETDGYAFHRTREQWANDCRKQTRAAAAGHRVMRVTHEDLVDMEARRRLRERVLSGLALCSLPLRFRQGAELRWPGDRSGDSS
jgi:very-short-patch-repair endonuclease